MRKSPIGGYRSWVIRKASRLMAKKLDSYLVDDPDGSRPAETVVSAINAAAYDTDRPSIMPGAFRQARLHISRPVTGHDRISCGYGGQRSTLPWSRGRCSATSPPATDSAAVAVAGILSERDTR